MMVVLPSAMLMAESHAAVMHPSGLVKLNGKGMARTVAVFAGDSIQTTDSSVTISAQGSSVFVPAHSHVTFKGGAVNLADGSALVTTQGQMAAEVGGFTVTSLEARPAKFEIAQLNGKIQVSAHEGALAISRGGETMRLEAGNAAMYDPSAAGTASGATAIAGAPWWIFPILAAGISAVAAYASTRTSPATPIIP